MSSVLYFFAATFVLVGLLIIGGFVGQDHRSIYSAPSAMSKLVSSGSVSYGDNSDHHDGGCASCRWY